MEGYFLFERVFYHLNEETQQIILRNIFSVKDVSTYSVSIREKKLIFRFFIEGIFYQFVFDFSSKERKSIFSIESDLKVIKVYVSVWKYVVGHCCSSDYYDIFIKILTTHDEYLIYSLIRLLI